MSEAVVVKTGLALCGHGFSVALEAGKPVFKINGELVLLHDDFSNAAVACTIQTPCKKVTELADGGSTVLTIGGEPVALASTKGVTEAGTFKVFNAGQTVLKAK